MIKDCDCSRPDELKPLNYNYSSVQPTTDLQLEDCHRKSSQTLRLLI